MRALVLADRPPRVPLAELLCDEQPDAILCLGDLTEEQLRPLKDFQGLKLGVYGNHCRAGYFPRLGIEDVHLRPVRYRGLRFVGLQGCVRYKEVGDFQYSQDRVTHWLGQLPQVDVFLTHCPPAGINDSDDIYDVAHHGFEGLRSYIDRKPPLMLLHGHTYPREDELVVQHGPTAIRYVHGHMLIDLPASS